MAAVAGLRGTGDWGTDERPKNFREMIQFLNHAGSAPIFALSARIGKRTTTDPEFSWWNEPMTHVRLQVAGALGTTETTIVVDSVDPTAANLGSNWGVATHLKPGDLLLVEPADIEAVYDHEILRVTAVSSATNFSVVRGAAGTTAAAIGDDVFLTLIGSAYAEGTDAADAASRNPIKYFNYTQIFKETYEVTRTAEKTTARTGDPVANDKKRKAFDHAKAIEMAILFGARNEGTGSNGKPLRTTGGIRTFLPAANQVDHGVAANTPSQIIDAWSPLFDYETAAGDERLMFAGNTYLNELNKLVAIGASAAGSIQWGPVVSQWGLQLRSLILPQGTVFIRSHPLLNAHGLYNNSAFILDMSALKWVPLRGSDTKSEDNIQAKGEDARRGQWITEAGLMVDHGGETMGFFGSLSAT